MNQSYSTITTQPEKIGVSMAHVANDVSIAKIRERITKRNKDPAITKTIATGKSNRQGPDPRGDKAIIWLENDR
ncbi:hypothetical protein Y032_0373g176 [Ancylostoma ceylanicum]|uniref:Uncharacterized protein n=1 Tax=Ancylostoma ceylanicum TaxID=53326 RepID=A0A016RTZ8_9BILA|nr:hypothetical protein Y032_0373g176 [Ancylostoma ceylanicum]